MTTTKKTTQEDTNIKPVVSGPRQKFVKPQTDRKRMKPPRKTAKKN